MEEKMVVDPDRVNKIVGARLKALRNARGLSREQLMKMSGFHWDIIRRVENGDRSISIEILSKLCIELGELPERIIQPLYAVNVADDSAEKG